MRNPVQQHLDSRPFGFTQGRPFAGMTGHKYECDGALPSGVGADGVLEALFADDVDRAGAKGDGQTRCADLDDRDEPPGTIDIILGEALFVIDADVGVVRGFRGISGLGILGGRCGFFRVLPL